MSIGFESIDDARDAVFDERHMEVDPQSQTLVGEPEIGQKLLLVDRGERLDGFDFDNDVVFDHQIGAESGVDADIPIDYRNCSAPCENPVGPVHTPRPYGKRIPASPGRGLYEFESGVDDLRGNGIPGQSSLLIVSRQDAKTQRTHDCLRPG
ncbi:MAG TPA: hypothetical protein VNY05_42245 [Candidatus Acidoferrales bacterium]|nr:hypothetical protein [Candidatus Acidoferrales bacterium]